MGRQRIFFRNFQKEGYKSGAKCTSHKCTVTFLVQMFCKVMHKHIHRTMVCPLHHSKLRLKTLRNKTGRVDPIQEPDSFLADAHEIFICAGECKFLIRLFHRDRNLLFCFHCTSRNAPQKTVPFLTERLCYTVGKPFLKGR